MNDRMRSDLQQSQERLAQDMRAVVGDAEALLRAAGHEASEGAAEARTRLEESLHAAREVTTKPVLGIAECGILTAMTLGQRFGVISILKKSISRHLRYVGQMGVADRMAGDRAIGLGVVELADEARTFSRMVEVAADLRDEDGADVLVMGCAGMARYSDRLQRHIGLPVVEPSQAAVARPPAATPAPSSQPRS